MKKKYKNNIFLDAFAGEKLKRPPVWMMRQAGRYLPDFRKLREKYSFFERVETPELAAEITIMPVKQIGVDVAILFSDILVVPQALDFKIEISEEKGPQILNSINTPEDALKLKTTDIEDRLHYVFEALALSKKELNNEVPIIGFAGAPWTIFCYLVEGGGSKTFDKAKAFCFQYPEASHHALQVLTTATISYLRKKVHYGADVIQIFDSWASLLSPGDYHQFSFPYIKQIVEALKEKTNVIVFPKGCWYNLDEFTKIGVHAIGLDWLVNAGFARSATNNKIILQGNYDPARLLSPIMEIKRQTIQMIKEFGVQKYIANLGHGILPNTPVDHAKAFVDTVKEFAET